MRLLLLGLGLMLLVGCAAFETSPGDVQRKLSDPTKGHLYERDPLESY
ncbi:MAG TPA: hypothetical protein VLZ12_11200 [Verrucomicrobiae bacterium]|nr:hypothetical protein [Verrucomicrobiae bacterium]